MNLALLDCCSLLNLFAGWGELKEFKACGGEWYVCDAVAKEALYVLEDDPNGGPTQRKMIDLTGEIQAGNLHLCHTESEAEDDLLVSLATEVDDGEAMAIAIAKVRGWILVSDDQKAAAVAQRMNIPVWDTATVIQAWANATHADAAAVREVVQRITRLARFTPPKKSPQYEWWNQQLKL